MAAYNKFNNFVKDLAEKKHDLNADQLNVYLSNATPSATLDFVKADLAEISAGNGYAADGIDTQNTGAVSVGVYTLTGTMCVWTASGGTIGPFQYVALMNFTQGTPLKPLICWWDYGSALTLQIGETFSVKFNGSVTTGTIHTIT